MRLPAVRYLLALLPAFAWAATITRYEVQVDAAQRGTVEYSAFNLAFSGEPDYYVHTLPSFMLTGAPTADSTLMTAAFYRWENETIALASFDSPSAAGGTIRYMLRHLFGPTVDPGAYFMGGWASTWEHDIFVEGTLTVSTVENPEPSMLIVGGLMALYGMKRYRAYRCSG